MTIDEDYAFVRDDVNLLIGYFVLCILDFKHSGYLNFDLSKMYLLFG